MKTLAEQFREYLKRFPEATESDVGKLLRITRDIEVAANDQAVQMYREISRLRQQIEEEKGRLLGWKFATCVVTAWWIGTLVGWAIRSGGLWG